MNLTKFWCEAPTKCNVMVFVLFFKFYIVEGNFPMWKPFWRFDGPQANCLNVDITVIS